MKRWCGTCLRFVDDHGYSFHQGLPVFDHLGKCVDCGNSLTDPSENVFLGPEDSTWFVCPQCNFRSPLTRSTFASGLCPRCKGDLFEKKTLEDRNRFIPSEVKRQVWNRDNGRCVQCGSNVDLHFDHDVPFSKGGASTIENVRILCAKCNLRKGNRIA